MFCLDTSILIEIFDGKEEIKAKLEKINNRKLSITPIILCELYKGAVHSQVTQRRLQFIENLLKEVDLLEFNEYACKIFSYDYLKLKHAGKMVKDNDLMIAAICKAHQNTLITSDRKHFEHIPNLKLEVW